MRIVYDWRSRMVLPFLVLALAAYGCEGDGGGDGGGGGGGGGGGDDGSRPAENCDARCAAKASDCGAPASILPQVCATMCGGIPTEDQARCLETESCDVLQQSFLGGALPCGIGQDGGGDDGGGDDGGGACEGEPSYCDGDELVSCVEIAGRAVEQRETCAAGCAAARCRHFAELCDPGFEGGQGCDRDECDRSDVVIVDGARYCTSSCGPDEACPSGTECFWPTESQSICLPPCTPGLTGECPDGFLNVPCGDRGACGLF